MDELDALDELEDLGEGDQSLPPGGTPVEFQRVEEERRALQAKLDEEHRQRLMRGSEPGEDEDDGMGDRSGKGKA